MYIIHTYIPYNMYIYIYMHKLTHYISVSILWQNPAGPADSPADSIPGRGLQRHPLPVPPWWITLFQGQTIHDDPHLG